MDNVLEQFEDREVDIKRKAKKRLFVQIESIRDRKIYHTKVVMDLYLFGIDKRQKHKFFIAFRGLFNQERIELFSLFALRDDDEFLGIFYGYRKPIQNLVTRYEENGVMKAYTFSKVCYIEFKFKKGSVYCYIKGISCLLKKEKLNTKYYKSLTYRITDLEKQVYEFYNKNLPNGGLINKWIKKNQR
ncbi:Putative cytosolic protein (plasmid) [Borrelia crocidurae DOU]|uniref:Putative cytosolic protein n=1 Tax=Borrelia crocidurae DOU TaxID=1293575 RepID=W5SKE8_9SPIR|nr:DUF226 domain-containing protein [Borrelia crocidurae]AHH07138.1 Putative cytosolic protein [Borrelia crocidurae DOU]